MSRIGWERPEDREDLPDGTPRLAYEALKEMPKPKFRTLKTE